MGDFPYGYTPDDARPGPGAPGGESPAPLRDQRRIGGAGALDPTINPYDLGDDPLEWKERTTILHELLHDLRPRCWRTIPPTADLNAFGGIMNEYARAVAPAIKYLGGAYINRDHIGDPEGRLPFVNVPRVK